jgi:hypothetical protein
MRLRVAIVAAGCLILAVPSAYAACEVTSASSGSVAGSPFTASPATKLSEQTSDNVRITGGCIDVPNLQISGTAVSIGGSTAPSGLPTDGTSNAQPSIQAALDAGIPVLLPAAADGTAITYVVNAPIVLHSRSILSCAGRGLVTIRLGNGVNADVIVSSGAYSSTNIHYATIDGCSIDGNREQQTSTGNDNMNCLFLYGSYNVVKHSQFRNCEDHGWRTGGTAVGGGDPTVESLFFDNQIGVVGKNAWKNDGPADQRVISLTYYDASQDADDTYDGIVSTVSGTWFDVHGFHSAATSLRARYQVNFGGGVLCDTCQFEGARQQVLLNSSNTKLVNSRIFAQPPTSSKAAMVDINSCDNSIIGGKIDPVAAGQDVYAINFMNGACRNQIIGTSFISFEVNTPFNFSSDGGNNIIIGNGNAAAGGATTFGGTKAATTQVLYTQGGTAINQSWKDIYCDLTDCILSGSTLSGTTLIPGGAITNTGLVGVGVVAPDGPLHIHNTSSNHLYMSAASNVWRQYIENATGNYIFADTTNSRFPIIVRPTPGHGMLSISGDNLGINMGTTLLPQSILQVGRSAATARVYNSMTDASNGEWALIGNWLTNVAQFGTNQNGSGSAREMVLMTGGTEALRVGTDQQVKITNIATTPGGKQPLCIDTSTKQIYAGSGGVC